MRRLLCLFLAAAAGSVLAQTNVPIFTPTGYGWTPSNSTTYTPTFSAGASYTPAVTVLNVKNYGAIGDGATDDTAAIQSAIDATTNSAVAGDVFLPAGQYKLTAPLRLWPNDFYSSLRPQRGPVRLVGNGSASTFLLSYVTNGAAIDARTTNTAVVAASLERLALVGPQARDFTLTNWSVGFCAGWGDDVTYDQYRGINLKIQDCAIDGFAAAVSATNVWGFQILNSTFHSNRMYGICLSKVHSAVLQGNLIRGVDAAGRFTGTGIAFIAPVVDVNTPGYGDSSWGFGDTAALICNNILFATNGCFNNELHLYAEGENYQFCQLFWNIRSGQRTNVTAGVTNIQMWTPWARLSGVIACDRNGTNYSTGGKWYQCETDSKAAPRIILENAMMDVCVSWRRRWNVVGANSVQTGATGNDGYIQWGSTNFNQPNLLAEANEPAWHNGTNSVTFYAATRGPGITNAMPSAVLVNLFAQSLANTGPALVISNGGNPYVPQLQLLEGGQGTSREAAMSLGGNISGPGYSGSAYHVGAIHGYTYANPYHNVPDVQLLSYAANSNRVWLGLGGTPGYLPSYKGLQEIHFFTAPSTNQTAVFAGSVGTNGGWTIGGTAPVNPVTNGQLAVMGNFLIRSNTAVAAPAAGYGSLWNSNGVLWWNNGATNVRLGP